MAEDFLGGLRGLAQVVPQPNSNLYALSRIAQQGKQNDRDFALKKQQQDSEWFQKQLPTGMADVVTQIQQGLSNTFRNTFDGMQEIYGSGDLTPGKKAHIMAIKQNYMVEEGLAKSLSDDVKRIAAVVNSDKDEIFDKGAFGVEMKAALDSAYTTDEKGGIQFNPENIANVTNIMEKPSVYNQPNLIKNWIGARGEQGLAQLSEANDTYVSTGQTMTNDFFETEVKDGRMVPKYDPKSGRPVVKVTPQSLADWDSNTIRRKILTDWAQKITPEGGDPDDYRMEALKKNVGPYAKFTEAKPTVNEKSAFGLGERKKQVSDEAWYNDLYKLTHEPSAATERLLNQTYDPSGKTRVVYSGGGISAVKPGESIPDEIVIQRREIVYPDKVGEYLGVPKYSDWLDFERIPIRTPEEMDVAMRKVNAVRNQAQSPGLGTSQGKIEEIQKIKHPKPSAKWAPGKGIVE